MDTKKMLWTHANQVALAADVTTCMIGECTWLATRMCVQVPTLINVHCIAHREALARDLDAGDAIRDYLEF